MKAMVVRCYYCGNPVPVDATVRIKVRTGRLTAEDEVAGETRQRVDFCRWCAQALAPRQYTRAQRVKKARRKQIAEWVARRRRPADGP